LRILVLEFFSAGGDGVGTSPALLREGGAMLRALLRDLAALRRDQLVTLLHPSTPLRVPRGVEVVRPGSADGGLREMLPSVDAVWLIAPETAGHLAALAERVEMAGRLLLGSSSAAVRTAADKAGLAPLLAAAGIPVPTTVSLPAGVDPGAVADALGYPLLVKPARGAGCEGVGRVMDPADLPPTWAAARAVAGDGCVLLQRYVPGIAASVTLAADGADATPLAVNLQRMSVGPAFTYRGGETPLDHPAAPRAAEVARAACRAVPGLRGYVGVDVVLGPDGATVVEINPRLTTAYLGVRAALDANLAALALAACQGQLPPTPPPMLRRVRFGCSGRVRTLAPLA
jgi:tyramine---L-glutamate ligase